MLRDAMTLTVAKRLANQNRVNCVFVMIGQSDMLSFYRTEKNMCLRSVVNKDDTTLFRLGRSAESFVVSLLSDQLAQPVGTVNAS